MFASYQQEEEGSAFNKSGMFSGGGALFDDIKEEEGNRERSGSSPRRTRSGVCVGGGYGWVYMC